MNTSWSFVFEKCLQNKVSDSKFLSLGVHWVRINTNRPETFGIATQLTDYADKIPPRDRYILQNWIKNWVYTTNIRNKSWTYGWGAYWKMLPTVENVYLALRWIESRPENINGAIWIIKELFRANRADVNNILEKWYYNHPNHPVSETIKKKLRL